MILFVRDSIPVCGFSLSVDLWLQWSCTQLFDLDYRPEKPIEWFSFFYFAWSRIQRAPTPVSFQRWPVCDNFALFFCNYYENRGFLIFNADKTRDCILRDCTARSRARARARNCAFFRIGRYWKDAMKIVLLSRTRINLSSIRWLIVRSDIETSMHTLALPRCTVNGTLHQFQLRFINADLQRLVRSRVLNDLIR